MTDITRIFNVETRGFTNVERKYSGQINDSISTVMHFEYNPPNFLYHDTQNDSQEYYVPYIVFDVHDDYGNPLVYGPESAPVFDGWEFSIPWDVTSRVKGQRLEYQLFFVKNTVTFNGSVVNLASTEYIQSAIDGISLKKSITCKSRNTCCPPTSPTTEPSIVGYINLWKSQGLVLPVEQPFDEATGKWMLKFHTYDGHESLVALNVPSLDDDEKISSALLHLKEQLEYSDAESEEDLIPTAKAVVDWTIDNYTPKDMSIAPYDSETTYQTDSVVIYDSNIFISLVDDNDTSPAESSVNWSMVSEVDIILSEWSTVPRTDKVPSEAMIVTALGLKVDVSDIINTWDSATSSNIASASLVKSRFEGIDLTLDSKVPKSDIIQAVTDDADKVPSGSAVYSALDTKVAKTMVESSLSDSNQKIPTSGAVSVVFNRYTPILKAIGTWSSGLNYMTDSTVIQNRKLYISKVDDNIAHNPQDDTENDYWVEITGGGGGESNIMSRTFVFGNAEDTTYELIHNFNTFNFSWSLRTTGSPHEYVTARVQAIDKAKVRIILTSPPGINGLTFNMFALEQTPTPIVIDTESYATASTEWEYGNTAENPVFIQTFATGGNQIMGDILQPSTDDFTPVTVQFTAEQTGTMFIVNTPYIYAFNNKDTWMIPHMLGTYVAVQCYNDTEGEFTGDMTQELDGAVINFAQPKSGWAIVVPPTDAPVNMSGTTWNLNHNKHRLVGVQTFDENGNQIFGDVNQDGDNISVAFQTSQTGFIIII